MAPFPTRRAALAGLAVLPALVLAACGADEPTAGSGASAVRTPSAAPSYPLRLTASPNPSFEIGAQPASIVSLSPTATEVLYAVGAGGQVKAVDDQSTYPAQAPRTKLSGFQPNVEAIAGYEPDLVVLSNDSNGVVEGLRKLDVPVYLMPAPTTLDGAYAQWQELGDVVGRHQEAAALVTSVRGRVEAAVAKAPAAAKGAAIYHELDQTFYSVSSATFIGDVYRRFGLTNIADAAAAKAGPYPQLSAEAVVKAAPAVIVLADTKCCSQSAATLAQRPGFTAVPAVAQDRVLEADDDIASRWGPRVADFAEDVLGVLPQG